MNYEGYTYEEDELIYDTWLEEQDARDRGDHTSDNHFGPADLGCGYCDR